jgi:branched-subunit amino acid ABC-type transport system permease component
LTSILQIVIGGLLQGGVFAIAALGFSLVFRVTNVVNLSQGAFCVLGAMGMYYFQVSFGWPILYQIALLATHLQRYSGFATVIQVFDWTHVYHAIIPAQHQVI